MPEISAETIRGQVEGLRRKLLDLSMRNRMLNYRPSKRVGVTILGEDACELHRMLVVDGKKMGFVGQPDPPSARAKAASPVASPPEKAADMVSTGALPLEMGEEAEREAPAVPESAEEQGKTSRSASAGDNRLNTDEFESVLSVKLRTIQREAQLAKEELGVNTLFLTLGTLEWNETEARSYRAPLLYLPVALERQMNGTIRLAYDGSDVGDNLPLRAKMAEFSLTLPEFDEERALDIYFRELAAIVSVRQGWTVHPDEICLGFFNYEKYAMYRDLGGETWPEGRQPWLHRDLAAMLGAGYTNPDSPITDQTFLDDVRPLAECHEIYDADSSQTLAMIRAASGLSIVVEGPPGTGKSQTITNIIAEAAADGKTVLFVAAKRAAVDVVKRRLTDAGLGAVCLDLHDKLTNRRAFYDEIKSTLNRSVTLRDEEERVALLDELRRRLTDHSRAVNEPLAEFGGTLTPFAAMASLARLPQETQEDRQGRIPFEKLNDLTKGQVEAGEATVSALQDRLTQIGVPERHAFWGAEIGYWDAALRLDLEDGLPSAIEACTRAAQSLAHAAATLHIPVPTTAEDGRVLRLCAERALSAPPLEGVALQIDAWKTATAAIRDVITALTIRRTILKQRHGQTLDTLWQGDLEQNIRWAGSLGRDGASLWSAELHQALRAYETHIGHWYRIVVPEFRAARRLLRSYLNANAPREPQAELEILRDVVAVQKAVTAINVQEEAMRRLFGVQWQDLGTDPVVLERLLVWVLSLSSDVENGLIPAGLIEFLAGEHTNAGLLQEVEAAERDADSALEKYRTVAKLLEFPEEEAHREAWGALIARLTGWQSALPTLPQYMAYTEIRKQVVGKGLTAVVEVADRWERAPARLLETFLRSYYTGVVREAVRQRAPLRSFDRIAQEQAIAEFRRLDDFNLKYNRARVRLAHQRRLPSFDLAAGNLQLLKVQCELKRSHKPIRWIMARAGEAIQRAKPVFMMSPLTVAVHLPPELPVFDMVIFDEASQIKPEDALCAVVRGKQIVVVGDTKQMPPSSFFDKMFDGDGDGDADDETEEGSLGQEARKLESVLSLMSAAVTGRTRRPDLRWHYRSLHPSLIQPSNELFYENRLIVFPCAYKDLDGQQVGIVFHHHPETVYESGERKRFNRREAEIVAEAVYRHVREAQSESLMIAAMNKPQADLIFEEVSKRERADPEPFQRFREAHPYEPLDVKNLENVQGDERDVVFISVTYGRDASGVIRQQFGPLLTEGGERRLNVLISRARKRCEVFSNITADDLRVDKPEGALAALKRYLSYAQTGRLDVPIPTGGAEESPFEEEVSALLRRQGYEVHLQVGCEGYRIDLAVADSAQPGSYLLGIECDGASYHSAHSARDRDKLRQRILEARGWKLHRIWSPDWWRDRDGEMQRLIAAIEEARTDAPALEEMLETSDEETEDLPSDEVALAETTDRGEAQRLTRPYTVAAAPRNGPGSDGIENYLRLEGYLRKVVRQEGPITHDLLFARLKAAAGYSRAGRNVRGELEGMIAKALRERRFQEKEGAYFVPGTDCDTPRDWSERPDAEKKQEYVPQIELAAALRCVVRASFGIAPDAAVREAFRLLGFRRFSEDALKRSQTVLEAMLQTGELLQQDGSVRLAPVNGFIE